jgi:hypothetical protein
MVFSLLDEPNHMSATLGNAAKYNSRLLAICNHCAHTVELNLQKLITKHGRDYPVPAL